MMCPCSALGVFLTALLNIYLYVNINLKECNLAVLVVNSHVLGQGVGADPDTPTTI